jgi:hypothetical protein
MTRETGEVSHRARGDTDGKEVSTRLPGGLVKEGASSHDALTECVAEMTAHSDQVYGQRLSGCDLGGRQHRARALCSCRRPR